MWTMPSCGMLSPERCLNCSKTCLSYFGAAVRAKDAVDAKREESKRYLSFGPFFPLAVFAGLARNLSVRRGGCAEDAGGAKEFQSVVKPQKSGKFEPEETHDFVPESFGILSALLGLDCFTALDALNGFRLGFSGSKSHSGQLFCPP